MISDIVEAPLRRQRKAHHDLPSAEHSLVYIMSAGANRFAYCNGGSSRNGTGVNDTANMRVVKISAVDKAGIV